MTQPGRRWSNRSPVAWRQALATDAVDLLEVMDDMLKIMTAQVTVRPAATSFWWRGMPTCCSRAALRACG
jgi:hypothetical protein